MPLYEFLCPKCGTRTELFVRTIQAEVVPPACSRSACAGTPERVVSAFTRRLTEKDQLAEAEAKFGKEVDAAMGPEPDVGRLARRYDRLAKDLPPPEGP